jgi:hypothetical protein
MSQSGRSEHDETSIGWERGQYGQDDRKSEERRRILTVAIIVLLFACAFICIAVAAYLYI